ncbi:MAG: 7-cyano-7-deazaguanine synthase, partial [Thermoplasmata archaeon]|nr:7-cyano-7-deazaguanine synthase [Thermoplasmata archaeon]
GGPFAIHHPLIELTKGEIVRKALELKVPVELTWSCYLGEEEACGLCDACQLRLKGFQEAAQEDPLLYRTYPDWYGERPRARP